MCGASMLRGVATDHPRWRWSLAPLCSVAHACIVLLPPPSLFLLRISQDLIFDDQRSAPAWIYLSTSMRVFFCVLHVERKLRGPKTICMRTEPGSVEALPLCTSSTHVRVQNLARVSHEEGLS